jgi:hypothetical protein
VPTLTRPEGKSNGEPNTISLVLRFVNRERNDFVLVDTRRFRQFVDGTHWNSLDGWHCWWDAWNTISATGAQRRQPGKLHSVSEKK